VAGDAQVEPGDSRVLGDSSAVEAPKESVDGAGGAGRWRWRGRGRWRCRRGALTIDVSSEEEDVVVASPASVEIVPEPSPRLEMAGPANILFTEAAVRTICLVGASRSAAQPPPTLTPEQPPVSFMFVCSSEGAIKRRPSDIEIFKEG